METQRMKCRQADSEVVWLQKMYMAVPGTVSIPFHEVYQAYEEYMKEQQEVVVMSKSNFGRTVCKVFSNIKTLIRGERVYVGLRPNFLTPEPCGRAILLEVARQYNYFEMENSSDLLKFGCSTEYYSNKCEVLKTIHISNDMSWRVYVGGREVNLSGIGISLVILKTSQDAKIIFNTVKQADICLGQKVDDKQDTTKFTMVQEWSKKGDENSCELRCTSSRCFSLLPFTTVSSTCRICAHLQYNLKKKEILTEPQQNIDLEALLKKFFPGASDLFLQFMKCQSVALNQSNKHCIRWDKEVIQVCLALWNRSPQGYIAFRQSGILSLPSECLLQRYKNCLKQKPGIHDEMCQWMQNECIRLNSSSFGGLIIDEMSVQEDFKLSFENGNISVDGLVDIGQLAEDLQTLCSGKLDLKPASHVMQFVFLGFDGFRFPIAYFPTAGANAAEIYIMVWEAINKLSEYDFIVEYVCMDGSSNNRAFQFMHFNDFDNAKKLDFTVSNPYFPSQKVTLLMDYSHNIKKLRNNLNASGCSKHSTRKLTLNGQILIWDYWIKAFTWDRKFNFPIRVHQKLKDEHIFLSKTSKMRNHLAEEVLDENMLNLMLKYQESLNDGSHLAGAIALLQHTSKLISLFRDRRPISDINDPRLTALSSFEQFISNWNAEITQLKDISTSEKAKSFISKETYSDLICMCRGFKDICCRRISESKQSVTPAAVNSDVVENFFCQQRTICNGSNTNPSVHQYKYNINSTILGQKAVSKKSNAGSKRSSLQPLCFNSPTSLPIKRKCIRI